MVFQYNNTDSAFLETRDLEAASLKRQDGVRTESVIPGFKSHIDAVCVSFVLRFKDASARPLSP